MKRLILLVIIFFFLGISTGYAYDWKKIDIVLVNQEEDGVKTILTLKDKQSRTFEVIYEDEVQLEKFVNNITKFKNMFYSWRNIRAQKINFMVLDTFLKVVIIPKEIPHNNLNLTAAIPAGIAMTYDPGQNVIYYDFRVMKDDLFIRITGDYASEDELLDKIYSAYDNPTAYLKRNSLSMNGDINNEKVRQALIYFYNTDWNGRPKAIPPEIIQKVVEYKQNHPEATKKQLWQRLKKEKVTISKRELDLILIIYFNEYK